MPTNLFLRTLLIVFLILFTVSSIQTLSGQDTITVKKCIDFKVSGDGNSPEWNNTGWTMIANRTINPVKYSTRIKVLYSEKGMYFLFDCEDSKITATIMADNQDLWNEDVVEVFLWPDDSLPIYFEYEISPLNFELPIIIPNIQGKHFGWLPWHYEGDRRIIHETSVTGGKKESGASISGWKAEFFIPFKLMDPMSNVPPVPGTIWKGNFFRMDYDSSRNSYSWKKTNKTFHDLDNFGKLIFE